ncbi:hypothetical protein GCM10007036_13880 [Alsobacter metallidurans]|uniref:Uncharacterized protein n=1 Tax=Alsobacter metallidurans TaxID=340221 RepID=A0A917I4U1_9HYPH|nr:hypothetical protein GCM10007036_13880 [Alsobacter metallidurans]
MGAFAVLPQHGEELHLVGDALAALADVPEVAHGSRSLTKGARAAISRNMAKQKRRAMPIFIMPPYPHSAAAAWW